ncbi:hypothetical protein B0H67DRAFT_235453 [Lasiosphaeris hirsuta]|uniref:Uncharacterized protein n=1 Tax=Lasiosphaeris hirsuta TaxID=260670 RepID=A0AA40AFY6_9PEZI|nr:hypothetical protein B0H67DRAFT_235453 [Lasiosphaeris hirsuta]
MFLLALFFLRLSLAADIILYQPGSCNTTNPSIRCANIAPGTCCQAPSPWCGVMGCDGCTPGTYLFTYSSHNCTDGNHAWCVEPDADAGPSKCCLDLGTLDYCGGSWEKGRSSAGAAAVVGSIPAGQRQCAEPSVMSFVDGQGVWRDIHLPAGSLGRATRLYMNGEWEGLRVFEGV